MPQCLRIHAVLAEGSGLIPRTHAERLTTAYNSGARETSSLFWPSASGTYIMLIDMYADIQTYTEMQINIF